MPVAQACFVVMKLCEGLDYAHNKRDQTGRELSLVHRDVSPQNVLVSFEGEVKIIDFGIAKAAGKGSKTQAGILKGKFGYMSPEQVRGLPVDRRSDVFSCGIVLYELLTGERLFVGESDFSTLEKVRNVEILPPSTYNRKIPDELERIVLKALSKDAEDRYQNAIDLHDELQAFVYTAGEFYSRKDLAGWMKKTFGKEIEEETAKLESYRQLKPPEPEPGRARSNTGIRQAVSAPPPPTGRNTGATTPPAGVKPPPPPLRASQQMAAVAPPSPVGERRRGDTGDLSWDDDELETKIYDNPEEAAKQRSARRKGKSLPLQPPPSGSQPMAAASSESNPDLSSLVRTSKGWDSGAHGATGPSPGATLNGVGIANGKRKSTTGAHAVVAPPGGAASTRQTGPRTPIQAPAMAAAVAVPAAAPSRASQELLFDPMASVGPGASSHESGGKKRVLMIAAGSAVITVAAIAGGMFFLGKGGAADPPPPPPVVVAPPPPVPAPVVTPPPPPPPPLADPSTGFDLYVMPAAVTQWRLDGEMRTDRLPSRIRGIAPGTHSVQIDPPPGFLSYTQQVDVGVGKAIRVDIKLEAIQGIYGLFESTPDGATISLIVDGKRQELGQSPAKAPLDANHTYQVLFEKPGYISINRPIELTTALEQKVAVILEKAPAGVNPPRPNPPRLNPRIEPLPPRVDPPRVDPLKVGGTGTLALGSKPSCEILVDGVTTGKYTPQSSISLPAGRHRITLVNAEYGIKESFPVDISPDKPAKMIKDYSDRLPK
jgi:serine/threonine protein kinase